MQAVRHEALTWLRRERTRASAIGALAADMPDRSPAPDRVRQARRFAFALDGFIGALPNRCREVFLLRFVERLSQKEVGRRMGTSEKTVEVQAYRARLAMGGTNDAQPASDT